VTQCNIVKMQSANTKKKVVAYDILCHEIFYVLFQYSQFMLCSSRNVILFLHILQSITVLPKITHSL